MAVSMSYKFMLENVCVVNRKCNLEKKKKKKEKQKRKEKNQRKKKKNVKNFIEFDQLMYFCLTRSSIFCTDEPGRQCHRWENLCESFVQIISCVTSNMFKQ